LTKTKNFSLEAENITLGLELTVKNVVPRFLEYLFFFFFLFFLFFFFFFFYWH